MKKEIDLDLEVWRNRVFELLNLESKLKIDYQKGKYDNKQRDKIQKQLNEEWNKNWDNFPDKPYQISKAFNELFRNKEEKNNSICSENDCDGKLDFHVTDGNLHYYTCKKCGMVQ